MISAFLTLQNPKTRQDPYLECIDTALQFVDELVIIDGGTTDGSLDQLKQDPEIRIVKREWPEEFKWTQIRDQFQFGYQQCNGDWVMRLDSDYMFHENDFERITQLLTPDNPEPAYSFYKNQFILADRYTIKSRVVLAVNRGKYDGRIKFDSGGDLCAPSLDGQPLDSNNTMESKIPMYNYDFSFKSKEVVRKDFIRFARAWHTTFGNWNFGGPTEEDAFNYFLKMQIGRFKAREHKQIKLDEHPEMIQNRISELTPEQFAYSMWGNGPTITYKGD